LKFPWYRIILSYFSEHILEKAPSGLSEELTVSLINGRMRLSAPKAIYSDADHYYNFVRAFDHLRHQLNDFKKILVLGTGLGSIPYILERKFNIISSYDSVDLDPVVNSLFDRYTAPLLLSSVNLITIDAETYMQETEQCYDLICVDIFIDHRIPMVFDEIQFLRLLKSRLNQDGFVIFNRLAESREDVQRNQLLEIRLQEIFGTFRRLNIMSNDMYIVQLN